MPEEPQRKLNDERVAQGTNRSPAPVAQGGVRAALRPFPSLLFLRALCACPSGRRAFVPNLLSLRYE
jgi:hypothetical protein